MHTFKYLSQNMKFMHREQTELSPRVDKTQRFRRLSHRSQGNTKREQHVRWKDVNFEEDKEEDEDVFIINLIISLFSSICENSAQSCPEAL